jgi:proton-translocating NADH-quinone oxidoreductase chain L
MMFISIISPLIIFGFLGCLFGKFFGIRGIITMSLLACLISTIAGLETYIESNILNQNSEIYIYNWIQINNFSVDFAFNSNTNNCMMGLTVSFITFCVLTFSSIYMINDPHIVRFISYISLFAGFMLVLIFSNNLTLLLIGWEGIGICSFNLIGFWFNRLNANKAAIKAIMVNRISDVILMLSISYSWYYFGFINFNFINTTKNNNIIDILSIFLIVGCLAKSALFILHTWLPDAMEGPTPVSALIHAATLVTAGIFVLCKCDQIWGNSLLARNLLIMIGGITAMISALSGLTQNDIKKTIAFSTCSQLGYMAVSIGFLLPNIALYHTITHAFFKAGLFLVAGLIISYSNSQQDNRYTGSIHLVSWASIALAIVISSLCGSFFTAGYYSKDFIIENGIFLIHPITKWAILILINGILLTSWYSTNIQLITNILKNQNNRINTYQINTSILLTIPIILLSLLSLWIGYLFEDGLSINNLFIQYCHNEFLPIIITLLPVYCVIVGSIICLNQKPFNISIYIWLNTRLGFDWIYNRTIAYFVLNLGLLYNLIFENVVFDKIGYVGLSIITNKFSQLGIAIVKKPSKNIMFIIIMVSWLIILL